MTFSPGSGNKRAVNHDGALPGAAEDREEARRRAAAFSAHRRAVCRDELCRASAACGLVWLVVYQVLAVFASDSWAAPLVTDALYLLPIGAAAVAGVFAVRASSGRLRRIWAWLAVSHVCWLIGEVIWSVWGVWLSDDRLAAAVDTDKSIPLSDVAYTVSYAALVPAAWIGFVETRRLWRARALLDAALVVLAVGSIGWRLLSGSDPVNPDVLVDLAYPAVGLLFVLALIGAGLSGHRGVPCSILLTLVGFGIGIVADAGYAFADAGNSFSDTSPLNLGWQAQAVFLTLGGVAAIRHPDVEPPVERFDHDRAFGAVLISGLVVALLVGVDQIRNQKVDTVWLGVTALVLAGLLARQALTTRERTRLAKELDEALQEQRRTAVTDGLTGLYNRPFFQALLGVEARRALHGNGRAALILVRLDSFAGIGEQHDWAAGDTVLVQVADRLRIAARPGDVLARYGVEEFACLLPQTDEEAAMEVAERFRQALRRTSIVVGSGASVAVTASFGVATATGQTALAEDDDEPMLDMDRLVRDADRALNDANERGGDRVVVAGRADRRTLADDVDVPPELAWLADRVDRVLSDHEHSTAVARWCLLVGGYLALDHIELRQVVAAGRLHDIGKFGVGAAILRKTDPLTDAEWGALRCHPEEGARLLRGVGGHAALAPLVAAHHERWDGLGYPEGIKGEDIPLGARIIAVCDSWAAMRVDRPYAPALNTRAARDEIERARGTQFDPIVVDAFLALLDQDLIDDPLPL
ncbi:bifunctional diguanylate cyclase/phosphohydrolase [Cryptosporangium arvum]|uniref:Diguanylate cyclase (GGDEF) domain-containing protein n=1 Tax=Cryptosporangium arvum DSM 44712 TaxID=927661 RepID=A0A010YKH5_9ACTN|nr:diguanylate cyclase [Cryptosporangium arvum]EXG80730.1 diguanylate cyclase (GGDEF) domain-containing protein [Cryptosporangium arvum DSM 44712]